MLRHAFHYHVCAHTMSQYLSRPKQTPTHALIQEISDSDSEGQDKAGNAEKACSESLTKTTATDLENESF